jgi:hypothetical protein
MSIVIDFMQTLQNRLIDSQDDAFVCINNKFFLSSNCSQFIRNRLNKVCTHPHPTSYQSIQNQLTNGFKNS